MEFAEPKRSSMLDGLAVLLLIVVAAIALATFRDYGLGWDDYAHAEYGELLLAFYGSGLHDQRALSFVNLYMYGGGFDMAAALVAKVLPFTLFETRRLLGAAVGLIGMIAVWRLGRRTGGPLGGLLAVALLAACPLYVGHMFINAKDAPFAVATAVLLLGLLRSCEEYPRPSLATIALIGIGFGLSFGSRIMGAFGALEGMGAIAFLFALQARRDGLRAAAARVGKFLLVILPALVLAYAVMALVWPWSVAEPLNPLRAVEYFSHFFEKPWDELFGGQAIPVTDMPRSYVPTLLALKLPEIFALLGFAGAAGALLALRRGDIEPKQRASLLLVALAALLPVLVTIAVRPAMYNGIRHFVFVLPPLAVLGGFAGAWLYTRARQRSQLAAIAVAAVLGAGIVSPVVEMVRLHPYEYTHFNRVAGGVASARDNYMLDYWALSLKQASQGLAAELAARHEKKPMGRRWKLGVCGPHRSPQVELGPDFETTWDTQGTDFAMQLGEFYCATFDAPVLVEIKRAGAVYARVYDIRGRSYPSLLSRPETGL